MRIKFKTQVQTLLSYKYLKLVIKVLYSVLFVAYLPPILSNVCHSKTPTCCITILCDEATESNGFFKLNN